MRILALDLGTKTGYAMGDEISFWSGTFNLATPKEITEWGRVRLTRRMDPRPVRLYKSLHDLCEKHFFSPEMMVFEDVEFQTYTKQCQLWASMRTAAWFFAYFHGIRHVDCIPVSTLKKYATGSGAADKEAMKKALFLLAPNLKTVNMDDNGVDAVWIWRWAAEHLCRMKL